MKKRNAVLLAGALAAGLACAPVQAKTFAVDLEGKTYYVTIQNGVTASAGDEGVSETEITVDYLEVSDEDAAAEEAGVTVQTQSEVTVMLPDDENAATFSYEVESKDGNTVTYRYLTDLDSEDAVTYRVVTDPEVEDAVTYRVVTDPEVEGAASLTGQYVAIEGSGDTASDWYMTITDEEGNIVAELPKDAFSEEQDDVTYLQLGDDSAVEQAYSIVFTGDSGETADEQERVGEYEKAGITRDDHGAWIFNDKKVTWLVDEDGGIYMNNSEKDKEKRCYVVIKRDEDGNITDVVDVSLEDAVKSALERE